MSFFTKLKDKFTKKTGDEVTTKYEKGLEKTRNEFVSKLNLLGIKYTKVSEEYFDELEKILISADIGINTVFKFMDRIKERVRKENIIDTKYLNEVIVDELFIIYVEGENLTDKINYSENGPTVILMIGVNGVGKTTTAANLGVALSNLRKRVLLIDDICTTGATLTECVRVLKDGGAESVACAAVALTREKKVHKNGEK